MTDAVQPALVVRAFVRDRPNAVLCCVARIDGDALTLNPLGGGGELCVIVQDADGLAAILREPTSTMLNGARLALVNQQFGLLGLAFGPSTAPERLEIVAVVDLADHSIPANGDQPGWRLFRLAKPTT